MAFFCLGSAGIRYTGQLNSYAITAIMDKAVEPISTEPLMVTSFLACSTVIPFVNNFHAVSGERTTLETISPTGMLTVNAHRLSVLYKNHSPPASLLISIFTIDCAAASIFL